MLALAKAGDGALNGAITALQTLDDTAEHNVRADFVDRLDAACAQRRLIQADADFKSLPWREAHEHWNLQSNRMVELDKEVAMPDPSKPKTAPPAKGDKPIPKPPRADPRDNPVRDTRDDPSPNPNGDVPETRPDNRP
ncbi:hypothetical protein LGH82_28990 [Mesorhizobium sp. PAMC28654]|uniref:hypothetical protein n=1 Tax=Mesorhizobium sp. PAMC28654 TaxID=2880934 RepID=UPI001D0B206C|nr:hypothetical protein [Mesorhizobium sp. PAMC28654]UDL89074.1 hypothetical protein LGH82_28990 [Mesorhizobium sp. PAMC28654]